nr:MAG TPA: hypothetical protein [Caudoviricetes sp.]DAU58432.1 MAG TPA: hypothetical protein [Caudoviricetes sp.]
MRTEQLQLANMGVMVARLVLRQLLKHQIILLQVQKQSKKGLSR